MKIFPASKVKEIDAYTIKNEPIASIDLMERAASRLTGWYTRQFKTNRKVVVFAGPGNNGGDALAMARMLASRQYRVSCCLVNPKNKLAPDSQVNLERLNEQGRVELRQLREGDALPPINRGDIVIDGLFGSGLTRPVEGFFAEVIRHINRDSATTISIDIPSGLFGEDNTGNIHEHIIKAHFTLTFQFPFLSFFFSENHQYTGRWRVLDIGLHQGYIRQSECIYNYLQRPDVATELPPRRKHDHKGNHGHALVIAGSHGMMGAAILTTGAALRTGAGLVTGHVPASGYNIIQTAVPEAIVSIDANDSCHSAPPDLSAYNAVAVGPGLGRSEQTREALQKLFENCRVPLVVDADALNLMATHPGLLEKLPENSILTPHPGEFDRLAGKSGSGWDRHRAQVGFSRKHRVIVLLKGAFSGISLPDGRYYFNTTGNPGMATGGSGDVLTGIIVSLLARGMRPEKAAITGAYIHGCAGDFAAAEMGLDAMIAGDIILKLGEAFRHIFSKPYLDEKRTGTIV